MPSKNSKIRRRNFLQQSSLAAGALFAHSLNSRGHSVTGKLLPGIDQKQRLIQSLYERGRVTTYLKSRNELAYIGMPVGGINTGTLYLGGDGRLWLWDIFNLNQEGVNPLDMPWGESLHAKGKVRSRDGSAYIAPAASDEMRPVEQGFAIAIEQEGKTIVRHLKETDWPEISFEATYPVAIISYTDETLPVIITMQVYSPFIPLDVDKSGLPATIFQLQVKNKSKTPVTVKIAAWLENKTALHTAAINRVQRKNSLIKEKGITGVYSTAEKTAFGNNQAENSFDYGTLCLSTATVNATAGVHVSNTTGSAVFDIPAEESITRSALQKLTGNVVAPLVIAPAQTAAADFIISWHTPNLKIHNGKVLPEADSGRYYDNRFKNAAEVAVFVSENFKELSAQTLLWKQTWYDSSLPWWFLERSFLNISGLATSTSHRFRSGRYWAWEGVGACEGNCTHVWQYAQAPGRIFPAMEKDNRERVDLGISLQPDGGIWFRGEYDKRPAIDGQAGRILGCYREHQMSTDNNFLQKNWDKIKRAVQFVISQDKNNDGMEDTPLENTLDAVWDGEIAWIVGLCIAAVKAGEKMAEEMNDTAFALVCHEYVRKGSKHMDEQLFNGEYFIHRPDPGKGRANLGSYNTCHIDQVYGQSWAFQVGLGRILDREKTLSALRALWKYNFLSDVGPYIKEHTGGRPYALAGEGGMLMNTNPENEPKPYGENVTWQMSYFNECMSGFEHQVAAHMMAEGMTDEALTLTKAIHDRYHAAKRNPFNEIECSDHYGRAMASYGTFITACGFEYHGPKGYIRFAPKWNKEHFKAAFTTAEGWGSYAQKITGNIQEHLFDIKYGSLLLNSVEVERLNNKQIKSVAVKLGNWNFSNRFNKEEGMVKINLDNALRINVGEQLVIEIT